MILESKGRACFVFKEKDPTVELVNGVVQLGVYTDFGDGGLDQREKYYDAVDELHENVCGDGGGDGDTSILGLFDFDDLMPAFIDFYCTTSDSGVIDCLEKERPLVDAIKLSLMQALEKINSITFTGETEQ